MKELKRKAIAGAGWTFGSAVFARALQFLVTVILAHLLLPRDFGLFALAFMVITAVNTFRDYSLAQSLIYEKDRVRECADATFWMSLVFGVLSWFALYLASPFIAAAFVRPELSQLLRVMNLSVLISSCAMVPGALLERELLFRKRAVPEIVNSLVYTSAAIVLAYCGYRVWSLIVGHVLGALASTVAMWVLARWRPAVSFPVETARRALGYGQHLMVSSILIFVFFYIDNAAIGRFLGVTALGYYSIAFTISNLPATNITHVINKVMFPTYTRLNTDMSSVGKAYLQTIRSISVLSFPLAVGLCALADGFVSVFLGEKWLPAVPLFRILAFYGLYRSIGATCGSVFMAVGQPQWVTRLYALSVVIAVALLYPVVRTYGTAGVAVLFTCAYFIGTTIAMCKVKTILGLTIADYAIVIRGPLLCSLAAFLTADFAISRLFAQGILQFALTCMASAGLYIWLILTLDKRTACVVREVMCELTGKAVRAHT